MGARASAPLRRRRGSEAPSPSAEGPLELAIISDPGIGPVWKIFKEELISRRWRGRAGSVERLVVVSRSAAYACPVPRTLYDELAATGHPVGVRVRDAQREAIARLWRRAHATTPAGRAHLPERCDPRWFRDTFCNGRGEDLGAGDDVWDLVVGFNLYDVIALLACCPALRAAHFSPHSVNVAGVRHQVVGRGDAATGVRDADALRKALADGIRDGIARAPGAARRAAR